jgi:FAD/FMN-containing dehydrogenase
MQRGSAELIAQLSGICGREYVLTESGELATYRSDGLLHYRQTPLVAVLPGDAHEVSAVVAGSSRSTSTTSASSSSPV